MNNTRRRPLAGAEAELARLIVAGAAAGGDADNRPTVDLEDLHDPALVYRRERGMATVYARRVQRWLDDLAAFDGLSLDAAYRRDPDAPSVPPGQRSLLTLRDFVDLIGAHVEVQFMARAAWPEDYEHPAPTEAEARAAGLSVRRPRELKQPTLPGCQGGERVYGGVIVCGNLRVRGHTLCPDCEATLAESKV